jgi:hypothetical protein
MSTMTAQRWQTVWHEGLDHNGKRVERVVGTATCGMDLATGLLFRLRRDQAEMIGHYPLQSIVLPEAKLRPQNREALALLEIWMSEPDDLGHEWWDVFEQDLRQHRFSLHEIE